MGNQKKMIVCPCGKDGYIDPADAVSKAWQKVKKGKVPSLEIYDCTKSGQKLWHLTSQKWRKRLARFGLNRRKGKT